MFNTFFKVIPNFYSCKANVEFTNTLALVGHLSCTTALFTTLNDAQPTIQIIKDVANNNIACHSLAWKSLKLITTTGRI